MEWLLKHHLDDALAALLNHRPSASLLPLPDGTSTFEMAIRLRRSGVLRLVPLLPCSTLLYLALPCPILLYLALSCSTLTYLALPCSTLLQASTSVYIALAPPPLAPVPLRCLGIGRARPGELHLLQ
jgi:hypothetical protein